MFHFKNDKHVQASGLGMLMYYFLIYLNFPKMT